MNWLRAMGGGLIILVLCACARHGVQSESREQRGQRPQSAAQFAGSTPGGDEAREFLGGLPQNAPCHHVVWRLALATNRGPSAAGTFHLQALYRVPNTGNTNQSIDGPSVVVTGTWKSQRPENAARPAEILVLERTSPAQKITFAVINPHLIHVLNRDGSLALGNGGASYTLNCMEHAEAPMDPDLLADAPSISYRISPRAVGPDVFGVFEGRSPCHRIANELATPQHPGCFKAKWRVTLFQDVSTRAPTRCTIEGSLFRDEPGGGTWSLGKGAANDPSANVFQLNTGRNRPPLLLVQGDSNVLFFLNKNREPLIGNADFSYTLNRVSPK